VTEGAGDMRRSAAGKEKERRAYAAVAIDLVACGR